MSDIDTGKKVITLELANFLTMEEIARLQHRALAEGLSDLSTHFVDRIVRRSWSPCRGPRPGRSSRSNH